MPQIPYNTTHLVGDTYVVPGLTNSGFVSGLVIDTCEDEAPYAGVAVDRLVLTHGHADHFTVAHVLRAAGARVAAARDDASLVENPDINIRGMFSWAKPGDSLTTKLFRGVPCEVDEYLETWTDPRATIIPLPGHTMGHCGSLTADGVLFTGDALYLMDLWERHPLPYAIDPGQVIASLECIREVDCSWLVPAHGRPVPREAAEEHIDHHVRQVRTIEELILDRLRTEHTTEQAVAMVSAERGLLENPATYWLAVTTVKGYLGELLGRDELEFFVRDHAGWWKTVG
ncbi:MAG: MBL fold metallo-hydrolase [Coriobacteriia bacterium]